jgi:hypothetical protein
MAMSQFDYAIEGGIAYVAYVGEVTYYKIDEIHHRIIADPNYRLDMPKLLDLTRVTNMCSVEELMRVRDLMIKLYAGAIEKRRIAIYSEDKMTGQIVKLFQEVFGMATEEKGFGEYRFFTSKGAAKSWLRGESAP